MHSDARCVGARGGDRRGAASSAGTRTAREQSSHTAGKVWFGPQSVAGVGLTTSCTDAFILLSFILAVSELLASGN